MSQEATYNLARAYHVCVRVSVHLYICARVSACLCVELVRVLQSSVQSPAFLSLVCFSTRARAQYLGVHHTATALYRTAANQPSVLALHREKCKPVRARKQEEALSVRLHVCVLFQRQR